MRQINWLVVHCTATSPKTTIDSIRNHWANVFKWKSPGYHVIVKANGDAITLLPIDKVSNGVKGHNHDSIHISYIGGVDIHGQAEDTRTTAQKASLKACLKRWKAQFPHAKIQGHRDFKGVKKACPSFDAKTEYQDLS